MFEKLKPELSSKNKYWIDRHRYYELKHFCLQYPMWKRAYLALDGLSKRPDDLVIFEQNRHGDPTAKCVEAKSQYLYRMKLVEQAAIATSPELFEYIIKGVTKGVSYEHLKSRLDIPCCRDTYYNLYRRFFWILNDTRN